jgi:hypothetical protein
MRRLLIRLGLCVGVLLTAGTAGFGQEGKAKVHRMEITVGNVRTVQYYSLSNSPGEQAALRDLERAENEAAYVENLAALRRQYVANELAFAPRRHAVQMALYGTATETTFGSFLAGTTVGASGYAYPYMFGGWANGYGYSAGVSPAFFNSTTVSQSLAYGVGDEGRLKTALAPVIAAQATPEYAASVSRGYASAVAGASRFPEYRKWAGLSGEVRLVDFGVEKPRKGTVTLKNNDKITGLVSEEGGDWVVVKTDTQTVKVRASEVRMVALDDK